MKKLKAAITCLLSLAMIFFMTGCWDYREVDTMSIVAGIAIDEGEHGQKYHTTFEILDLTVGKEKTVKPRIIETDGATVFDAVRNAVKLSANKLFFSHCKVVVINSKLAKAGINPIIDWLRRDAEVRLEIEPVVSEERTAKEVLESKGMSNPITSYEISKMLENDDAVLSKSPLVRLYQINNFLQGEGISLTLPVVKNEQVRTGQSSQDQSDSSDGQTQSNKTPALDGAAIFKGDRLLGRLNSEDTKYYLFIRNKVKGGLLVLDYNDRGKSIALEIMGNKTSIKPVISHGQVHMEINVKMEAALAEDETSSDYSSDKGIKEVERLGAQTIERHIKEVIADVQQQYDSDIFGFGNKIYYDDYSAWQELKPQWDKKFMSLQCDVMAQVDIENTATEKSKVKAGG